MLDKSVIKEVEAVFSHYRICLLNFPKNQLPILSEEYRLLMPDGQDESEDVELSIFLSHFIQAFNRLTKIERTLIYLKYLNEKKYTNYRVSAELLISESSYYRLRLQALERFALAYGIKRYDVHPYWIGEIENENRN